MLVLGIESTCDETAAAVVKDGHVVLSNVVTSQMHLHATFGGVVPELACRQHVEALLPVIQQALKEACVLLNDIDLIAVSYGPGLIGALLIGLNGAKTLSLALDIPFVGVNHIEAHLFAAMMEAKTKICFPALGAVFSGGHSTLVLIKDVGDYQLIGETVDDAIGEAFDKAAKILGFPYPGGPWIEKKAAFGNQGVFSFKGGQVKSAPLNFSFSGLKTALLYAFQKISHPTEQTLADLALAFQEAAFNDVIKKIRLACNTYSIETILLGGGVTANQTLRKKMAQNFPKFSIHWPSPLLSLDNAAMIAGLGYHIWNKKKQGDPLSLEATPRLAF